MIFGLWSLDGDNLRHRVFYKLLEKAELRRVRSHDLRHTFASLLLQHGESPAYVKEQMGHSSIQVTVDIYGHLIPSANRCVWERESGRPREGPRRDVMLTGRVKSANRSLIRSIVCPALWSCS